MDEEISDASLTIHLTHSLYISLLMASGRVISTDTVRKSFDDIVVLVKDMYDGSGERSVPWAISFILPVSVRPHPSFPSFPTHALVHSFTDLLCGIGAEEVSSAAEKMRPYYQPISDKYSLAVGKVFEMKRVRKEAVSCGELRQRRFL